MLIARAEHGRRLLARERAALLLLAAVGAATAISATLGADFLRYPGWLGAQKADLVAGPVLVGLYWRAVRPTSRFGWVLIVFGLVNAGYIAQSFTNPRLFGIGLLWESLIYLGTQFLILTFPTGRLDGLAAKLILAASAANAALNMWLIAMLPQTGAGGAISSCRTACPRNGMAVAPNVSRALELLKPFEVTVMAVAAATALLLIWRLIRAKPPRRRALAIGTPVALFFLVSQIVYLWLTRFGVDAPTLEKDLPWVLTGARAFVWYGFLFALIAAQVFAGRALRTLVLQSVSRPSKRELETILRGPLGDPTLQLRFWDGDARDWDAPIETAPGPVVTVVERDGRPAAALIHDAGLADDPELVEAAGAVVLMVAENAELDAAWHDALNDVRHSRTRIVQAVDDERRRLAGDLHDGVQQRLGTIRLRLATTSLQTSDAALRERIAAIDDSLGAAIQDVRDVSHRLYPRAVREDGLLAAIEHAIEPVRVDHTELGRHKPEIEAAVYYCVLEAVQNARKHGGPHPTISVSLRDDGSTLTFEVTDDGPGFDPAATDHGLGLQSLSDRVRALAGDLSITSATGRTTVAGSIPLEA